MLFIPHVLVAGYAWSWFGFHPWICSAIIIHCIWATWTTVQEGRVIVAVLLITRNTRDRVRLPEMCRCVCVHMCMLCVCCACVHLYVCVWCQCKCYLQSTFTSLSAPVTTNPPHTPHTFIPHAVLQWKSWYLIAADLLTFTLRSQWCGTSHPTLSVILYFTSFSGTHSTCTLYSKLSLNFWYAI